MLWYVLSSASGSQLGVDWFLLCRSCVRRNAKKEKEMAGIAKSCVRCTTKAIKRNDRWFPNKQVSQKKRRAIVNIMVLVSA